MSALGFIILIVAFAIVLIIATRAGDSHGVIAAFIIYGTIAVVFVIGLYELYSYIHEHVKIIWQ